MNNNDQNSLRMKYENISVTDLFNIISEEFDVEIRLELHNNATIDYINMHNKTLNEILKFICNHLNLTYKIDNNVIYVSESNNVTYNLKIIITEKIKNTIEVFLNNLKVQYTWKNSNCIYITSSIKQHQQINDYFNDLQNEYNKQVYISIKIAQINTNENNINALYQITTNLFASINELNKLNKSNKLFPINQVVAGVAGMLQKHEHNTNINVDFECEGGLYIQNYKVGHIKNKQYAEMGFDFKIEVNIINDDCININLTNIYSNNALHYNENYEISTSLNIQPNQKYIISSQIFKTKGTIQKKFFNNKILNYLFFFLNNTHIINRVSQYIIILEAILV